jgi:hypothetical protein
MQLICPAALLLSDRPPVRIRSRLTLPFRSGSSASQEGHPRATRRTNSKMIYACLFNVELGKGPPPWLLLGESAELWRCDDRNMGAFRYAQTGNTGILPNKGMPNTFVAQAFDTGDPCAGASGFSTGFPVLRWLALRCVILTLNPLQSHRALQSHQAFCNNTWMCDPQVALSAA